MSENPPFLSRQIALIGPEATERLRALRVMVVGLGGVGGYAVEALARCGVGELILVDHDTVSESNRNRQIIALTTTVGRYKTDAFAERIAQINPDCTVKAHPLFVTPDNLSALLDESRPDWIIDAIDSVAGKCALAIEARERAIPILASLGTGNKLCPERLCIGDLSKTRVCPLARVMRRELKARGISHMQVLWSDEEPSRWEESDRRTPASISFVPPSAGLLLASHLVRAVIAGEEERYRIPTEERAREEIQPQRG